MIEKTFGMLVGISGAYLLVGVVVAVLFFTLWLRDFDPSTKEGNAGFRVFITPGLIALWPFIIMKIFMLGRRAGGDGSDMLRRNHRIAIIFITTFGLLLFAAALAWRAPGFDDLPTTGITNP